jgi:ABC-type antimicrobial peptide transport system permease subunit
MGELAKDQPVEDVTLLERAFADQFGQPRFQSQVMGAFALISLLLAMVGIYGVNSYAVAQRRREIGVRMALGATPARILGQVLGRGMALTGIGIALGLIAAVMLGPVVRSVLVGAGSADPVTLAAVAGLLALVAAVACYIPAHRATRVHPAIALRQD